MKRVVNRTLDRFVVFRERSIGKGSERPKNSPYALRIHDERAHVIFGLGIGLEGWHGVAHPFLRAFVPPDLLPRRIPGFAIEIAGRAVVQHPAVGRPGESPIWIDAQPRGVFRAAPRRKVSSLGE